MPQSTDTGAPARRGVKGARRYGEGSIRKRSDGRFEARYWMVELDGTRTRRSICNASRAETARKLREALTAKDNGRPLPVGEGTVGEFLTTWIAGRKADLRPGTWTRYEQLVRVYLVPGIGKVRLTALQTSHVAKLYAELLRAGKPSSTVLHVHRVLRSALNQAERWGQVVRNVAAVATVPRVDHQAMKTLTAAQVKQLLEAAPAGDRPLYLLAVSTGMRLGELLALRWADVDLNGASLGVVRTGSTIGAQGFVEGAPKTRRSRRRVELSADVVAALSAHKVAQIDARWRAGQLWVDHDLVFPGRLGKPRQGSNVTRNLQTLLSDADLPRLRFHDLRHTAASLMLASNVHPKIVSEMLGHSSIGITLDTYSHVLPTMQREAAQAMADLLR